MTGICGAPPWHRAAQRARVSRWRSLPIASKPMCVRRSMGPWRRTMTARREIILSDDGSSDATFAVMRKVARGYAGPYHLRLNRNNPNLSLSAHVNRVLAMAQDEISMA